MESTRLIVSLRKKVAYKCIVLTLCSRHSHWQSHSQKGLLYSRQVVVALVVPYCSLALILNSRRLWAITSSSSSRHPLKTTTMAEESRTKKHKTTKARGTSIFIFKHWLYQENKTTTAIHPYRDTITGSHVETKRYKICQLQELSSILS